jgi:solute carrier family 9B (sodium/hydrogen exchanger), member 1/2
MAGINILFAILELAFLYIFSVGFGEFISWFPKFLQKSCSKDGKVGFVIDLPTFLGQLLGGVVIANLPGQLIRHIPQPLAFYIRNICLAIILTRAGLNLDLEVLKKIGGTTISLACIPCLCEATIASILCKVFRPSTPWPFCFCLGFVEAAVSPAVVVPNIVALADKGYGLKKGIPTMILAATSLDVLVSVTGIGISVDAAFSSLENGGGSSSTTDLVITILIIPISIIGGIGLGYLLGRFQAKVAHWAVTAPITDQKLKFQSADYRAGLLIFIALSVVLICTTFGYDAAAYLCVMTMSLIVAKEWNAIPVPASGTNMSAGPVGGLFKNIWVHAQPILLTLIGSQVILAEIESSDVSTSLAILALSLICRLTVTYIAVTPGSNLSTPEKRFVALAWFPKATAQAALGSVVLDNANNLDDDDAQEAGQRYGNLILTAAVLAILLTAPIGAVAMPLMGPKWLEKQEKTVEEPSAEEEEEEPQNIVTQMALRLSSSITGRPSGAGAGTDDPRKSLGNPLLMDQELTRPSRSSKSDRVSAVQKNSEL